MAITGICVLIFTYNLPTLKVELKTHKDTKIRTAVIKNLLRRSQTLWLKQLMAAEHTEY